MIKIEYAQHTQIRKWNNLTKKIATDIHDALTKGYIGNKRKVKVGSLLTIYNSLDATGKATVDTFAPAGWQARPHNNVLSGIPIAVLDQEAYNFLKYLDDNNQQEYWTIVKCKACDLEQKITDLEHAFPILAADKTIKETEKRSFLYKVLYKLFVENGYRDLTGKHRFYETTGIGVCPYCNQHAIRPYTVNKETHVTGQLDHFYSKTDYPYLAMTKENLVPSCSVCNGEGGKHDEDFYHTGLLNPYLLNDSKQFRFGVDYAEPVGNITPKILNDTLKITFNFIGPINDLRENARVFKWRQRYRDEAYKELALNTVTSALHSCNDAYQAQTVRLSNGAALAEDSVEIFKRINKVSPLESDFNKYPNAKFIVDICKCVFDRYHVAWPF